MREAVIPFHRRASPDLSDPSERSFDAAIIDLASIRRSRLLTDSLRRLSVIKRYERKRSGRAEYSGPAA